MLRRRMWPILFRIPLPEFLCRWLGASEIPIRSFGVLMALGMIAGIGMAMRLSRRFGADPQGDPGRIARIAIWLVLGILAGGRILYVFIHPDFFRDDLLRVLRFWEGGMVFYGGFFLCFLLGIWRAPQLGLDLWKSADILTVAGMLGYGIGRIGCLLLGDDYGREIEHPGGIPWALRVPDPLPEGSLFGEANAGKWLHPAQIYMSICGFSLAGIGLWLLPRKRYDGQVCGILILLYAIARFVIEFYRGDDLERGFWGPFSISQWISMGLLPGALFLLWRCRKPMRREEERP